MAQIPHTSASSRPIDRLFEEYGDSHRHPVNKLIHWFAVPAIFWSVLALLSVLPFPFATSLAPWLDWAVVVAALGTVYYLTLSAPLAIAMALVSAAAIAIVHAIQIHLPTPLWQIALAVFAVAWVFQFIGHAIEGKRPSFFKDLQFLLIGPAWVMAFVFRGLGIGY